MYSIVQDDFTTYCLYKKIAVVNGVIEWQVIGRYKNHKYARNRAKFFFKKEMKAMERALLNA